MFKILIMGSPTSKALTCMKIYLYKQKWQYFFNDEQFIHHTQINLSPNTQFFSTQQHAYQLLPGLLPFASLRHAGRVLNKNVYMNRSYSYPTTIYESIYAQMYVFLVEKCNNIIYDFCLKISW